MTSFCWKCVENKLALFVRSKMLLFTHFTTEFIVAIRVYTYKQSLSEDNTVGETIYVN